jgi:hypothetical protein
MGARFLTAYKECYTYGKEEKQNEPMELHIYLVCVCVHVGAQVNRAVFSENKEQ